MHGRKPTVHGDVTCYACVLLVVRVCPRILFRSQHGYCRISHVWHAVCHGLSPAARSKPWADSESGTLQRSGTDGGDEELVSAYSTCWLHYWQASQSHGALHVRHMHEFGGPMRESRRPSRAAIAISIKMCGRSFSIRVAAMAVDRPGHVLRPSCLGVHD